MALRIPFYLHHLPHGDIQKVLVGNLLARISAEGMFIFHENGGFLVLENPECLQMMQLWFTVYVVTSIDASEVVAYYGCWSSMTYAHHFWQVSYLG